MDERLEKVFERLTEKLNCRLTCQNRPYTSEETIRWIFIDALREEIGVSLCEIVLEEQHPNLRKAKLDLHVLSFGDSSESMKELFVEFKYNRRIPSRKNQPRLQKVGDLFKDIYRLSELRGVDSTLLLIYLTDMEMARYLRKEDNGFLDFFELPKDGFFLIDRDYILSKPKTFRERVGEEFSAVVRCVWKKSMGDQHELRIYEILTVNAQT